MSFLEDPHIGTENSLPQWAVNALIWFAVAVVSIFTAAYGWIMRKYIRKIDDLEKNQANFALQISVSEMELRMPELVSRTELLAYMSKRDEDIERRAEQTRQDQIRMHGENLKSNEGLRDDIRAVHSRIDELFDRGSK